MNFLKKLALVEELAPAALVVPPTARLEAQLAELNARAAEGRKTCEDLEGQVAGTTGVARAGHREDLVDARQGLLVLEAELAGVEKALVHERELDARASRIADLKAVKDQRRAADVRAREAGVAFVKAVSTAVLLARREALIGGELGGAPCGRSLDDDAIGDLNAAFFERLDLGKETKEWVNVRLPVVHLELEAPAPMETKRGGLRGGLIGHDERARHTALDRALAARGA